METFNNYEGIYKSMEPYSFIAKMDNKGRLRIPKTAVDVNGYQPGAAFKVVITKIDGGSKNK